MKPNNYSTLVSQYVTADIGGASKDADQIFSASAQMVITGTGQDAPAGNLVLQASNDNLAPATNWSNIATLAVSGAGTYMVPKTDCCYKFIRPYYDNTVSIAHATLTVQGIVLTSVGYGSLANAITFALVDPGAASQSLSITVVGSAITVHLATDSGSAITSTASSVITALGLSSAATALVTASGSGAIALTATAATNLSGGRSGGTITSVNVQTQGI